MKLVVGLGNKGREYENTRHNMGFMLVDRYLQYKNITDKFKDKFNAIYIETTINNEKVIFIKPMTYMNNSGIAVRAFVDFYKLNSEDILVISDDLDLDLGKFRLRRNGSSGGHNGLKSIISHLGTDNFKRLRIGISNDKDDVINYVLSKFSKKELSEIDTMFDTLVNVLDDYFVMDFTSLMSKYNRKG
ncbi:MAG TPA: aminoacyl-tRNA hydrolase [Candidatus Onthousia faecipullorum]|uniref:Peptidyl-tRNA hydrolase n=1 Tax=Candidatus Onthousia faecipullorum TaxID=2840887 RepID=A0A9D1GBN2_9FIRM|nr:aminoacyl-tRNA hydrolase [Candidatus Onthousia faecipullorum]